VSTSFSSIKDANEGLVDNNTIENKLMKIAPKIQDLACCNLSAMGYADPFMLYDKIVYPIAQYPPSIIKKIIR
jgi:hypothetical protein